jgi:hypothetical protein
MARPRRGSFVKISANLAADIWHELLNHQQANNIHTISATIEEVLRIGLSCKHPHSAHNNNRRFKIATPDNSLL